MVTTLFNRRRSIAIVRSRALSRFHVAGKSGSMKTATKAQATVAAPSTICRGQPLLPILLLG